MELPRLKKLYETYRDEGFEIIAIDRANDKARAEAFINENQLPYVFLDNGTSDEDEVVRNVFGNRVFPTSYFLDAEGKVRNVHIGFEEGDEVRFEAELKEILGK